MNTLDTWRLLNRTHAAMRDAIEHELVEHHHLALVTFAALDAIASTADGRLGMAALADAVGVTRSGCTRLVERAEGDGLIARKRVHHRHVDATLTSAGRAALRAARPTYAAAHAAALDAQRSQLAQLGRQLAAPRTRPRTTP